MSHRTYPQHIFQALRGLAVLVVVELAAGAFASVASAQNLVSLAPADSVWSFGQTPSIDLAIDFTDPSLGGGIVIEFDESRLGFLDFSFDPASPDDPALRLVCPSADPACANFPGPGVLVAFAVDTISFPVISGPHVLGTLRFETLRAGPAALSTREDDSVAGPLVGLASFDPPSMGTATLSISPPPAVPATGWLAAWLLAAGIARAGALALRGELEARVS